MKNEKLLDAIGQIDEKLISDAVSDTTTYKIEKLQRNFLLNKKRQWLKWGLMAAACLAVAVTAYFQLIHRNTQAELESDGNLPILTISENNSEAMGFEGYMAYDISELVNANPWNESMPLSALPVFENPLSYDEYYIVSGADFDAMKAFLTDVSERLGMDAASLAITDNTPDENRKAVILEKMGGDVPEGYFNPTQVMVKTSDIEIVVETDMTATISFEPAIPLPEQYHFTHFSSYEDMNAVAEYLKNQYGNLIDIDNPQVNIHGGDYDIYLRQGYRIEFFDAGGSTTEQIVNYNFNRVAFYCDDSGELFLARVFQPDLSRKTGDYPIISSAEARELLLAGNYITTVPYAMPGETYIAKTELVYRTGKYEKYYMPYYRFYVELPEKEREGGLKTYGAYYVPAVEGSFISNMPVWDGSFN